MEDASTMKEEKMLNAGSSLDREGPWVRTSNAVLRESAGEHLLVPIRRSNLLDAESLYILDDVGVWLWTALSAPRTLRDLVDGVRAAFDETEARDVEADVLEWLRDMVGQGMVEAEGNA